MKHLLAKMRHNNPAPVSYDSGGMIEDHDSEGLEAAAYDLLAAIHRNDAEAVAEALRSAFEILDAAPRTESPHTGEEI